MCRSEAHVKMWIQMVKALLKHSVPPCVDTAYRALREKEKLIKWKVKTLRTELNGRNKKYI
jgi:hypothetical protein